MAFHDVRFPTNLSFGAIGGPERRTEIVALASKRLYEMGSEQVEAVNAVSGERCNPHPHNFTDRLIRPGDQAEVSFELNKAVGFEPGVRFAMREGGRTVGAGMVTEVA